jgi:hypothetical protein
MHHGAMRTTINLDEDVLPLLKTYAQSRSVALGKAVSELVRRGLSAAHPTKVVNGIHIVVLPPDSPPVTAEQVKSLEAELE